MDPFSEVGEPQVSKEVLITHLLDCEFGPPFYARLSGMGYAQIVSACIFLFTPLPTAENPQCLVPCLHPCPCVCSLSCCVCVPSSLPGSMMLCLRLWPVDGAVLDYPAGRGGRHSTSLGNYLEFPLKSNLYKLFCCLFPICHVPFVPQCLHYCNLSH